MTRSGDEAVAAADARAASTREVNLDSLPPLPVPADTANVRFGPELDDACLALLPLVGVWRGEGRFGNEPGERGAQFGQQVTFAHDGRAFLRYESVMWLLGADGEVTGPGPRETGWLRPVVPAATPAQRDGSASAAGPGANAAAGDADASTSDGARDDASADAPADAPADASASATDSPHSPADDAEEPAAGPQLRFTVAHADGGVDAFVGHAPALTRWEFVGARGSRLYGITPDGQLAYVDERIPPESLGSGEPEPHASALLTRLAG